MSTCNCQNCQARQRGAYAAYASGAYGNAQPQAQAQASYYPAFYPVQASAVQQQQSSALVPYGSGGAVASSSGCACPKCQSAKTCHITTTRRVATETQFTPSVEIRDVCRQGSGFQVRTEVCSRPTLTSGACSIDSTDPCKPAINIPFYFDCPIDPKVYITKGPNMQSSFTMKVGLDTRSVCLPSPSC